MTDIVERLRFINTRDAQEAADEIERLRKGFEEYACTGTDKPCGCYAEFVRDTAEIKRLQADHAVIISDLCREIDRLRIDDMDQRGIIEAWKTKADQRADRIAKQQAEIERLRDDIAAIKRFG